MVLGERVFQTDIDIRTITPQIDGFVKSVSGLQRVLALARDTLFHRFY
jgi:hypothetical protein